MSHLTFEVIKTDSDYWAATPVIDGVSLPKVLEAVERPFAEREGHPLIAGKYVGALLSNIEDPNDYFFGKSRFTHHDGKTPVMECKCGTEGCWPLLAKIEMKADLVRWSEFEQPHRRHGSAAGHWTYEKLNDLVFPLASYIAALEALALEIREKHD